MARPGRVAAVGKSHTLKTMSLGPTWRYIQVGPKTLYNSRVKSYTRFIMKSIYTDSDKHRQLTIYDQLAVIGHELSEMSNNYPVESTEAEQMEQAGLDVDTVKVRIRDAILS